MIIKLAKLGDRIKEIEVPEDSTLEEMLNKAEVVVEGYEIRINGKTVADAAVTTVEDQDIVTAVPPINGGQ